VWRQLTTLDVLETPTNSHSGLRYSDRDYESASLFGAPKPLDHLPWHGTDQCACFAAERANSYGCPKQDRSSRDVLICFQGAGQKRNLDHAPNPRRENTGCLHQQQENTRVQARRATNPPSLSLRLPERALHWSIWAALAVSRPSRNSRGFHSGL